MVLNAASRVTGVSRNNPNRSSTAGRTSFSNFLQASSAVLARTSPPKPPISARLPALAARRRRDNRARRCLAAGQAVLQGLHHVNDGRLSFLRCSRNCFSLKLRFNQFAQTFLEFVLIGPGFKWS